MPRPAVGALVVAVLAALALALPSAAPAAPRIGVGEQKPQIFTDPAWLRLGLEDVRLVVSWDATRVPFERAEIDAYMAAAEAAGVRVLIAFGRTRLESRRRVLPTPRRYRQAFRAFRKRWPYARAFVAWNEANHCSQPTCHRPKLAAAYYDQARMSCPRCRLLAASVLDAPGMVEWVREFQAHSRYVPRAWGINNYLDANKFTTAGTRALLAVTSGQIWFTETGGLVRRGTRSPLKFPDSRAHAAKATDWVFSRLARLSPRVKRVYLYHWRPATDASAKWDSALVDSKGRPRPAYDVLRVWVRRAERAARARAQADR